MKKKIILRTAKPKEYFGGHLIKYFGEWSIGCDTYSGGSNIPMLDILDYRATSEKKLREMISKFRKKHKLLSRD